MSCNFKERCIKKFLEKNNLTLESVRITQGALKMHIPAASMEILFLPVGLRHFYQALAHSDASK